MRRVPAGPATRDARPIVFAQWREPTSAVAPTPDAWPELLGRWHALRQALPSLVATAVKRIVGEELATRPEHIRELVEELLARTQDDTSELVLEVHPDDATRLSPMPALARLRIELNAELTPGGCVLASEHARLDARLETRLARVLAALPSPGDEAPT